MSPRTRPILVLGALLLGAYDLLFGVNGSAGHPLKFENVERVEHLDVRERQTVVFRTETEWVNFWNTHVDSLGENEESSPPEIDFDQNMVLGLFWGRTTGCTSLVNAITAVRVRKKNVIVQVNDWTDGTICQIFVQPKQVIKTSATNRPVRFEGDTPKTAI